MKKRPEKIWLNSSDKELFPVNFPYSPKNNEVPRLRRIFVEGFPVLLEEYIIWRSFVPDKTA